MGSRKSAPPGDALDAALLVAASFGRSRIKYAIGGALAYGFYGVPRGTNDVDVNVFVPLDDVQRVVAALRRAGVEVDAEQARNRAEREGMFVGHLRGMRIDVFVPSIPFSDEAGRTRVQHVVERRRVWFLSAEALAVFKLLFFRGKDVVDLERMIAVMGGRLDRAYVRRWIVEMMGDDDERVTRWDALVEAHGR